MENKLEIINTNNLCSISKTNKNKKQDKKHVKVITEHKEDQIIINPTLNIVVNKGTGAGGANTTYYGKKFEEKTNNYLKLVKTIIFSNF